MLDAHPVLKDRLTAAAVFTGIAIGAVAGFELVITGGFDFLLPSTQATAAPMVQVEYVDVTVASYEAGAEALPVSSYVAPAEIAATYGDAGELAGAGEARAEATEEDVRRDIADLYQQPPTDNASASESASPW